MLCGNETLQALVLSWTGYPSLPPDVATKMYVKYPENDLNEVLAEATQHLFYGTFRTNSP